MNQSSLTHVTFHQRLRERPATRGQAGKDRRRSPRIPPARRRGAGAGPAWPEDRAWTTAPPAASRRRSRGQGSIAAWIRMRSKSPASGGSASRRPRRSGHCRSQAVRAVRGLAGETLEALRSREPRGDLRQDRRRISPSPCDLRIAKAGCRFERLRSCARREWVGHGLAERSAAPRCAGRDRHSRWRARNARAALFRARQHVRLLMPRREGEHEDMVACASVPVETAEPPRQTHG